MSMACIDQKCSGKTEVIDSRAVDGGRRVWRNRRCMQCGKRFATHESLAKPGWKKRHDLTR